MTYYARYLGCCSVIKPGGEEATAEAVKTIVQGVRSPGYKQWFDNNYHSKAKKDDRKLNRVALLVSIGGIRISDLETGIVSFDYSIYRLVLMQFSPCGHSPI